MKLEDDKKKEARFSTSSRQLANQIKPSVGCFGVRILRGGEKKTRRVAQFPPRAFTLASDFLLISGYFWMTVRISSSI